MPNSALKHPVYLQAEEYFQNKQNEKCLALLQQLQNQEGLNLLLQQRIANRLFIIYTRLGDIKQSEAFVKQSLQLALRLKNRELIYNAYDNMAALYMQQTDPLNAIQCLQKSLRLKEKAGNEKDMSTSLLQLSGLHFKIENIVDGKKCLEQAAVIIKKYKQTQHYAHLHFAKGMQLRREKKYNSAIKEYTLAVRYSAEQNNHLLTGRSLHNQASLYIECKQWKQAHLNLTEELRLVKLHGIKIDELTVYIELARVAIALKKTNECFTYIQKAKQLSKTETNPMVLQTLHDVCAQYYEATKKYRSAVKHYKGYIYSHANTYNQELSSQITQLQAKFQAEKRERELKEEQLKRTQTELNLMRTQMNPHFLYNAINTIRQVVNKRPVTEADKLLGSFAKLMRDVLESSIEKTITLEKSLEILTLYMQFEQMRKEHPFTYQIQIDPGISPSTTSINGLLIQPLVENAIKHGLFTKKGPGHISIQISKTKKLYTVTVTDNGVGRAKAARVKRLDKHTSQATNIIRQTLQLLWKDDNAEQHLHYTDLFDTNGKAAGTKVSVIFPA